MFDSLGSLVIASAEGVKAPERVLVSEAAAKYRRINNKGSYVGKFDNTITPYLVEPMNLLTSKEFDGMVFVGPTSDR